MTNSDVKVDQTVETANQIAMRCLTKELEENRYDASARREILDKIDKLARYEAEAAVVEYCHNDVAATEATFRQLSEG